MKHLTHSNHKAWLLVFAMFSFGVAFAESDDDDEDDIPTLTTTGSSDCDEGFVRDENNQCVLDPTQASGTGSNVPETSINDSDYGQAYPDCPSGYEMVDGTCEMVLPDGVPEKCRVFYETMMKYPGTTGVGEHLVNCIMLEAIRLVVNEKIDEICDNIRNDPDAREDWEDNMVLGAVAVCSVGGGLLGLKTGSPAAAIIGTAVGGATCGFYVSTNNDDWVEVKCDL